MIEHVSSSVNFSAADLLNIKRKMQIQELLGKGNANGNDGIQMLLDEKVFTGRRAIGY
jgi:Sec7-like guanine-nucleotide exchange factor